MLNVSGFRADNADTLPVFNFSKQPEGTVEKPVVLNYTLVPFWISDNSIVSNYTISPVGVYDAPTANNNTVSVVGFADSPLYILVLISALYAFLFVAGLAGNLFVIIFSVIKRRIRKNMTNLYMNLSIADVLILAISVPVATVDMFANDRWYLGQTTCK